MNSESGDHGLVRKSAVNLQAMLKETTANSDAKAFGRERI